MVQVTIILVIRIAQGYVGVNRLNVGGEWCAIVRARRMVGDDVPEHPMCGGREAGCERIILASLDSQHFDARCQSRRFHAQ